MNYTKVQIEIMKAQMKWKETRKKFPWKYEIIDDVVYVTEGHFVLGIPKNLFFLDVETTFDGERPLTNVVASMLKEIDECHPLIKTNEFKKFEKMEYQIFKLDEDEIWIDSKLLNYFPDGELISYGTRNTKSPVFIKDKDTRTVYGLVMPIKH